MQRTSTATPPLPPATGNTPRAILGPDLGTRLIGLARVAASLHMTQTAGLSAADPSRPLVPVPEPRP